MSRFVLLTLYFIIFVPLCLIALSWQFYAFHEEPNWIPIIVGMVLVAALPFATLFAVKKNER